MTESHTNVNEQVERLARMIQDSESFTEVYEDLASVILEKVEERLSGFEQVLKQANLNTLDNLQKQIEEVREETGTLNGVLERLKNVTSPDIEPDEEITTFKQAIENLEKYGTIIPTQHDYQAYSNRYRQNQAWSLFRQSFAKLLINRLQRYFDSRSA